VLRRRLLYEAHVQNMRLTKCCVKGSLMKRLYKRTANENEALRLTWPTRKTWRQAVFPETFERSLPMRAWRLACLGQKLDEASCSTTALTTVNETSIISQLMCKVHILISYMQLLITYKVSSTTFGWYTPSRKPMYKGGVFDQKTVHALCARHPVSIPY